MSYQAVSIKMSRVEMRKLSEIDMNINNAMITAIIISKSDPHYFMAKITREYRGVIVYTIRDADNNVVNCKCWGSKQKIQDYHERMKMGDIIDVICPRILPLKDDDETNNASNKSNNNHINNNNSNSNSDSYKKNKKHEWSSTSGSGGSESPKYVITERYAPSPTVPFTFIVNEGLSFLVKHNPFDTPINVQFNAIKHKPHKPVKNCTNLKDLRYALNSTAPTAYKYVDVLVMVAVIRPIREYHDLRKNQKQYCLELIVVDQSNTKGMILNMWNADWMAHVHQNWLPLRTVVYLIDAKLTYSDYFGMSVLNFCGRTVAYENPAGKEACALIEFVLATPYTDFKVFEENFDQYLPDPATIDQQMIVDEVYQRIFCTDKDNELNEFTAVVYGMVTHFDIDGLSPIISRTCKKCKRHLRFDQSSCSTPDCQSAFTLEFSRVEFDYFFNIKVHISDSSGTLMQPRVTGNVAERLLGVTVDQWSKLHNCHKTNLKWKYLLNYVEAKLWIRKPSERRRRLTMAIVDMRFITPDELIRKVIKAPATK